MRKINLFLAFVLGAVNAYAASFDCRLAKSLPERLICSDDELSSLDDEILKLHTEAKQYAEDKMQFKEEVRKAWLDREENCKNKSCLIKWYDYRRNSYLGYIQQGSGYYKSVVNNVDKKIQKNITSAEKVVATSEDCLAKVSAAFLLHKYIVKEYSKKNGYNKNYVGWHKAMAAQYQVGFIYFYESAADGLDTDRFVSASKTILAKYNNMDQQYAMKEAERMTEVCISKVPASIKDAILKKLFDDTYYETHLPLHMRF